MTRGKKLDIIIGSKSASKVFFDTVVDEIGMADAIIALVQFISDEMQESVLDKVISDLILKQPNRGYPHLLEHDGKKMSIADWSLETGIDAHTIGKRLERGWSVERALTEKVRGRKVIEVYV